MRLVVGGYAQGKLDCVLRNLNLDEKDVARSLAELEEGKTVLYGLHTLVAQALRAGGEPEADVLAVLARHPDVTVICDELGSGVVPVDAFEREWRERVGRLCCEIAARAQTVVRVFCGLGQVIKGSETWS